MPPEDDELDTAPIDQQEDEGSEQSETDQGEEDLDDADPDDTADTDEGEEGDESEQTDGEQPRGRAASRISKLANEKKAAKEEADRAKQDLAALRAQMEQTQRDLQNAPRQQQSQQERAALLEAMDPIERVKFEAEEQIRNLQQQIRSVQLSSQDSADKSSFLTGTHTDLALRQKYLPEVEKALTDMRKNGMNAPRQEVYHYLLGKALAARMGKNENSTERKAAKTRVENTQGKTVSVRSDASGGRKGKSAEERLENTLL